MPIDWFTVAAQAVNFLILVWLMKRFLYKPILHTIDEREKGIAAQRAEAEAKKAEAQKERDELQHQAATLDRERAALLKKATEEASAERQRLFDEARKDADSLRAKRREALRSEQRNLNQEIGRWTQNEVFTIARKTLTDLAATSLEERMCEVFVHRLRALTGEAREQLAAALKTSTQPAQVRSAFDLPPALRSAIAGAVKEAFAVETQVQFATAPELVSGIEFSANGQKVAWTIADYLATLAKSASAYVDAVAGSAAKPDPKGVAKHEPKNEPEHGPEPVASAPRTEP
jgi:F-type H+-transporting ATPase subunit b